MFTYNRNLLHINQWWDKPPASEYIEIKMIADANGKVYVPTAGSPGLSYPGTNSGGNGYYGAPYDWDIYVDGLYSVHISGNSSRQGYREVKSGLTPGSFHFIKIIPYYFNPETLLPNYGRAMAFAMGGSCVASLDLTYKNPIADYLYEIIYDGAIMGYKCSETVIGAGYKTAQFAGCSNLRKPFPEIDVSMVTSIGMHFLAGQYCQSGVTESVAERTPDCTAAQTGFREQQYWRCPNLLNAATEIDPPRMGQGYYHSYREGQYAYCVSLRTTAPENPPSGIRGGDEYKFNQYLGCSGIRSISRVEYCPGYGASEFRGNQFYGCGNPSNPLTAYLYGNEVIRSYRNSLGLEDSNVYRIYVPSTLLTNYQNDGNRSNISDNKFVGF